MATIELIAELHEIKELLCDAVRYNPAFIMAQTRGNKNWSTAINTTKEFERLIKTCDKGNTFNINIKKFELKEKIPIVNKNVPRINGAQMAYYNENIVYINSFGNMMPTHTLECLGRLASNHNEYYCYPNSETQATALHTRLTALINMIPVKKTYVKKVTPLTLAELNPKQLLTQQPTILTQSLQSKTKIHKISLDNCELRNLQASDYSLPITNLSEFANIQFYFRKSEAFRIIHLHCVGPVQYLIGNDHKLYVFMRRAHSAGGELVQGSYYDKLQCWTF